MKNLDHVRMTSRRLSYVLQGQVHLYRPEANELRMEIDRYVEAERQDRGRAGPSPDPRLSGAERGLIRAYPAVAVYASRPTANR